MPAIEQFEYLFRDPEFAIPFAGFPDQSGLVPHFLTPANRNGSRPKPSAFSGRRSTRQKYQRNVLACRVDRADHTVCQTDIRVKHHRLGKARNQEISVRHAHGSMLMPYGNRGRDIRAGCYRFGQAFDYWRKIRS